MLPFCRPGAAPPWRGAASSIAWGERIRKGDTGHRHGVVQPAPLRGARGLERETQRQREREGRVIWQT